MIKLQLGVMLQFVDQANGYTLHSSIMVLHPRGCTVMLGRKITYPCHAQVRVSSAHERQSIDGAANQLGTDKPLRSLAVVEPRQKSTKSSRLLIQGKQSLVHQR